jgi:restriction endonuclease S subunit
MKINLNETLKKKIDKTKWVKQKFSDFVKNIVEKVTPNKSEIEHYIGLEHLDSGLLKITRYGKTTNLKGDKLKIYKGDFIVAKRNAYLKRASVADFNAIASAHSFVLRAKPDKILPNFLSYFLLSDLFWQKAIEISVGSLSPTINWKSLAKQEFLLPKKEEQEKLAELLLATNEIIENNLKLKNKYALFYNKYLNDCISGCFSNSKIKWSTHTLGELGETFGGLVGKTKNDFGDGKPFITYMNIFKNSKVNPNEFEKVMVSENEKQNQLKFGDILFTGSSETPDEVGMSSVFLERLNKYYLNSFCFGFRLYNFDILLPEYARYLLRSNSVRNFMHQHAQGSTRFNLSKTTVRTKLKIIIPDIMEQKKIYEKIDLLEKKILEINDNLNKSLNLQKSLINKIF